MHSLQTFKLNGTFPFSRHFLIFQDCSHIRSLAFKSHSLTTLEFSGTPSLDSLLLSCHSLTSLSIINTGPLRSRLHLDVPAVRSLELESSPIRDATLQLFMKQKVVNLKISSCDRISSEQLAEVIKKSRDLKILVTNFFPPFFIL
jgi:hypothetical protein